MTPARRGTVYLVGAGPGADALVTTRCLSLVRSADVLIYDHLIPGDLVDEAPDGCIRVPAGKRAGDHTIPQDEINALLVREARAGRAVVRLKGGDPYLFGRGGEEAAGCRAAGVPFEVVSAVTSAFSVPASAGIPVTHRGVSAHVTVVTASAGPDGRGDPDWAWLAASSGTVVLLMGLRRLQHVAASLIAHGAPADRPAAVISHGTTATQRTIAGSLMDIAARVDEAELIAPAIIVVGEVVRLRATLDWFEQRPLFGRTITVTRARAQASSIVAMLEDLGARVVETPMIRIEPLSDEHIIDALIPSPPAFVVLTSRNGAARMFEALRRAGRDARSLGGVRVAVVGQGTADVCRSNGVEPDISPPRGAQTSMGLLERLAGEPLFGSRVVVIRAEVGDERFIQGLRDHGAEADVVHAYRTVVELPDAATVTDALSSDLVTFTSASTVRNFARVIPEGIQRPRAISIGPVTTIAAREHGFEVVAEATQPGVDGLVDAVLRHVTTPATTASP